MDARSKIYVYLDKVQNWITVTGNDDDENDKHLGGTTRLDRKY